LILPWEWIIGGAEGSQTDVAVRFIGKPGVFGSGRILDISMTGAALPAPDPYGGRSVAASIVRHDARGVGLESLDLSAETAKTSARLL